MNKYKELLQKNQFAIYRDGQLDRGHFLKQRAKVILQATGHATYRTIEVTVNVLDELVQAAN